MFHDLGNLNFTFLVPTDCYDLEKQLSVIQLACRSFGIEAVRSGRNDILAEGRKFSGNAFYQSGGRSYHHGTLLVDVDMTRMSRYLNPSKAKLEAKGVDSVRSRVVNLKELAPEITIDQLKVQLAAAFQEVYHLPCKHIAPEELDRDQVEALYQRNCSWDWRFGKQLPFTFSCQDQFPWGGIQMQLQVEGGMVREVQVFSDAMDWESHRHWNRPCRLPICPARPVPSRPAQLPGPGRNPLPDADSTGDLNVSKARNRIPAGWGTPNPSPILRGSFTKKSFSRKKDLPKRLKYTIMYPLSGSCPQKNLGARLPYLPV